MRRLLVLAFAIAAAALAGGTLWTLWPVDSSGVADANDVRQVALGQRIYQRHCASCHGANLEGQLDWRMRKPDGKLPAPPHDESGHTWHHPDEQLFQITKFGLRPPLAPEGYESDMPGFAGTLSDEEIWAALAYIKNAWPEDIRNRQSRRVDATRR